MRKPAAKPPRPVSAAGIYLLTWPADRFVYVGGSLDVRGRIADHLNALTRGSHRSFFIRWAFNCSGLPVAEVPEILALVDRSAPVDLRDRLAAREVAWIAHLKSERWHVLNLRRPDARNYSGPGFRVTRGRRPSAPVDPTGGTDA